LVLKFRLEVGILKIEVKLLKFLGEFIFSYLLIIKELSFWSKFFIKKVQKTFCDKEKVFTFATRNERNG